MSKADLSTALVDAGGGTRRKIGPEPVAQVARTKPQAQKGREGTKTISLHFPPEVRNQLKILAVEQGTTVHALGAEAFNMLFAKYGKPEVAPAEQAS